MSNARVFKVADASTKPEELEEENARTFHGSNVRRQGFPVVKTMLRVSFPSLQSSSWELYDAFAAADEAEAEAEEREAAAEKESNMAGQAAQARGEEAAAAKRYSDSVSGSEGPKVLTDKAGSFANILPVVCKPLLVDEDMI